MKLNILISLCPLIILTSTGRTTSSSIALGGGDTMPRDIKEKMMTTSDRINNRRTLHSEDTFQTFSEVMIKNLDCSACMEAYPFENDDPNRRLENRDLAVDEVFVTALNCDAGNPHQVWSLNALDASGIWNLFENVETESCMQLVGECSSDGALYTIEMGECDPSNPKAIWGVTGIGQIVNFDCSVNVINTSSTTDVFLEAKCGPSGGKDRLDISSLSSGSEDAASNFWAVLPKDLLVQDEDECYECGNCSEPDSSRVGCSCETCETIVCDNDWWCCNVNWDSFCAEFADNLCGSCSA